MLVQSHPDYVKAKDCLHRLINANKHILPIFQELNWKLHVPDGYDNANMYAVSYIILSSNDRQGW